MQAKKGTETKAQCEGQGIWRQVGLAQTPAFPFTDHVILDKFLAILNTLSHFKGLL